MKPRQYLTDDEARAEMLSRGVQPSVAYQGLNKPWPGVCLVCGRPVRPFLGNVLGLGHHPCGYCAGRRTDPSLAEGKMLARGFRPSVPFTGAMKPWAGVCLRCGRPGSPTLQHVTARKGDPCAYCAQRKTDPDIAWAKMIALDFVPSVPYRGRHHPWPGVCLRCGNPGAPRLSGVQGGQGPCNYCGGNRLDDAIVMGKVLAFDFQPSVPFPGAFTPWPGVCVTCGQPATTRYADVTHSGIRPCRHSIPADIVEGKMLAQDFHPSVPFPGIKSRWPGVCHRCGRGGSADIAHVVYRHGNACAYCAGKRVDMDIVLGKMRARDFEPTAPYPGNPKAPWPGVCTRCGLPIAPTYGGMKRGQGVCPRCSRIGMISGYRTDQPGTLYLLWNEVYTCHKVGITNHLDDRMRTLGRLGYTLVEAAAFDDGMVAITAEAIVLSRLRSEGFAPVAPEDSQGFTETFAVPDSYPIGNVWASAITQAQEQLAAAAITPD